MMRKAIYAILFLMILAVSVSANAQTGTPHGVELSFNGTATGYNVYRCPGTCSLISGTWAKINGSTLDPTITYLDPASGLAVNTTYSYAVTAVNSSGNESAYSNIVTVTTPASFPVNPAAPTGLTAIVQ